MKALLYKEFKLAMHPICYVFIALFPFLVLIPSYPVAVGFVYILSCYPILFLGANKGQQSNDLLYSTLLPIRKKDIVLARIITVSIMQFAYIAIMSALIPVGLMIQNSLPEATTPGLNLNGFVSILGIALIGFSIADLIYFSIYYKNGKSIVMSTLMTILGFIVYLSLFTIAVPYFGEFGTAYTNFLCNSGLGYQFIVLGASLVIYVALHFIVYKVASKELERVDF